MATKKKTAAPSKTVTKDQIAELQRLNARQLQADEAERATAEQYVSPGEPTTGSDEAIAAAEAAAAEAEKIQADIAAAGGEKAYVLKNAKKGSTTAELNKILPEGQKISGTPSSPAPIVPQYTATDGTKFYDQKSYQDYQDYIEGKRAARQSAYDLMFEQFSSYGLGSLVEPLRDLISDPSVSPAEFTIKLRQTDAYKKRFAANAQRIAKGLSALSEADYIAAEDRYQRVLRQYGLPASYYEKGDLGVQKNFEKLIANDVRDDELLDRVQTAYDRVINAAPEVSSALKQFYPSITDGDILAYALDPENALSELKRKVTTAEIGGAAKQFGLAATLSGAQGLADYGVTQQQARQGYQAISEMLPRGSELASIYKQDPYTQAIAEAEVFGTPGAAAAATKRKKLSQLEQAAFSGSSGVTRNAAYRDTAMSRDAAGSF